jgi:hypothetical protein
MKRNKFGSIRKLPSGRFQVRYFDDGIQRTAKTIDGKPLTFSSEKEARIYLVHLESDFARGNNPYEIEIKASYTIRDRVEMYLDPKSGARLSGKVLRISTLRGYRHLAENYIYRQLDDFNLADLELTEITRTNVMKWFQLIQASCVANQVEIKTKAHPARIWAKSQGLISTTHGRISPELKASWIAAGAPIVRQYREGDSGASQLSKAYRLLKSVLNVPSTKGATSGIINPVPLLCTNILFTIFSACNILLKNDDSIRISLPDINNASKTIYIWRFNFGIKIYSPSNIVASYSFVLSSIPVSFTLRFVDII